MSLPKKIPYELMLTQWGQQLDPVVANPIIQGTLISSILLNANVPKTIPTTLGRVQQGWIITDIMSNAVVWRTQPFNSQNITLESNADTTLSIWVF